MLGFARRGRVAFGALCSLSGAFLLFSPLAGGEAHPAPANARSLLGACDSARRVELEREAEALGARFAPTFLQETSDEFPERDRPLPLDFDGDFRADNNWEHLGAASRKERATVYGSAILTASHAYLTYTLFYPRDWATPFCVSYLCHDNDLETVLVVARRRERSLVFVETKSHRSYRALAGAEVRTDAFGRPLIQVETEGHGMRVLAANDAESAPGTRRFFHEASALGPTREPSEAYGLASLYDRLWSRRPFAASHAGFWTEGLWTAGESGPLYYAGERAGRLGSALGASMAGRVYAGGVRPPWALKADRGARGDWFLDPAFVARARHARWLAGSEAGKGYVLNPYLADLEKECRGASCAPAPREPSAFLSARGVIGSVCLMLGVLSGVPRAGLRLLLRTQRAR